MLIGIALGSITGGVYGWFTPEPGMEDKAAARAFAGALLGGIPGLIVGLFAGLIAMAVADLYSKLTGQRLEARAGGLVKAEIGDVYYCAVCRRQQSSITDIDCGSCGRRTVRWNSGRESEAVAQARWDDMNRAH